MALYSTHDMAFQSAWSGLVQSAQEQSQVLMGAPGGITTVSSHGHQYLVHQFTLAANGERQQVPIGRADDPNTTAALQEIQQQVAQSKLLIGQVRALAKLGYQIADPKTYSVL